MNAPVVCILMATYNGAAWLDCQLQSIREQTFQDWQLLISDDGSTDGTTEIIDRYCRDDRRIRRIDRAGDGHAGPRDNFNKLLARAIDSPANLFMFCDQDDYWYPGKIDAFVDRAGSNSGPCLTYSDFELADAQLAPLETSYSFKRAGNRENGEALGGLLSLNHIPGCSMAINRKLAVIASPIPDVAIMHDWWLALAAAACGNLVYIDEKLVKYRQHAKNAVGVTSVSRLILNVGQWPALWRKGSTELCGTMQQAGELAGRLENDRHRKPELQAALIQYTAIATSGRYARLKMAGQLGLRKGRGILRFVLYLKLLLLNCRT